MTATLNPTWRRDAACAGQPADLWFPDSREGHSHQQAVRTCRRCPVRVHCLEDAMQRESGEQRRYGIFGGLSARQRQQLDRCRIGRCHHHDPSLCHTGASS